MTEDAPIVPTSEPTIEAPQAPADASVAPVDPVAPTEPAPAPPEPQETKRARLIADMAHKDRQLRQREQAAKQAERELRDLQSKIALKDTDRLRFLKEFGFQEQDLVELLVENPKKAPEVEEREEARRLLDELKQARAEQASQAQAAKEQAAIETILNDADAVIKSSPEKYELIIEYKEEAKEAFLETVGAYVRKYNVLPDYEEILDSVNSEIESTKRNEFARLSKYKRFQPKGQQSKESTPEDSNVDTRERAKASHNNTLTNQSTSAPAIEKRTFRNEQEELDYLDKKYANLLKEDHS